MLRRLPYLILCLSLIFLWNCGSKSRFFVEMQEMAIELGEGPPCDDCTIFTIVESESTNPADFIHGGTCPQIFELGLAEGAAAGDLKGATVYDINCSDAEGMTQIAVACLDFSEDCEENDEFNAVFGINDAPETFDIALIECCMVLSYTEDNPFLFFLDGKVPPI